MLFSNRQEAGRRLATELMRFKDRRPVVLALPPSMSNSPSWLAPRSG